jgi:hypothetical protein
MVKGQILLTGVALNLIILRLVLQVIMIVIVPRSGAVAVVLRAQQVATHTAITVALMDQPDGVARNIVHVLMIILLGQDQQPQPIQEMEIVEAL